MRRIPVELRDHPPRHAAHRALGPAGQGLLRKNRDSGFGIRDSENAGSTSSVKRSQEASPRKPNPEPRIPVLFGIVQGGIDRALRRESAEQILDIGFEGYALGGLSVGEPKGETYDVTEYTAELLPWDRPRYLMGVGTPSDLVECVADRKSV